VRAHAAELGLDLIGASFGASIDLIGFWHRCGLPPVHIGTSRNAASGAHAAVVLAGISPRGLDLAEVARRRLSAALPTLLAGPLRDLEPGLALALLDHPDGAVLPLPMDAHAWRALAAFGHANRPYEAVIAPLAQLAATGLARGVLTPDGGEAQALVAAVLQHRPLTEVATLTGETGRAGVITRLRAATRTLLSALAPAHLAGYLRDLSEGASDLASLSDRDLHN
jgi:tRNA(Met) cytidine acetyltransferase